LLIVGISAFLRSEAKGHHYSYHKSLFRALGSGPENEIEYIGARDSKRSDESAWFHRSLPKSMTRNAPWASPFRLIRTIKKFPDTERIAFIYEGNFAWLLLTTVLINSGSVYGAHVNLFNSGTYLKVSKSRVRTAWIKTISRVIIKLTDGRIIITAETPRLADLISGLIGIRVEAFPYFSSTPDLRVSPTQFTKGQHKKVLINIRGNNQIELVLKSVRERCKNCEFTLHGLAETTFAEMFHGQNISISQHLISQEKYIEYFSQFDAMIFAYDKSNFEMQSSGRLLDAIKCKVPVVVPQNTSMEDTVNYFKAGTALDLESPEKFATILGEFHNLELYPSSASLSDLEFLEKYLSLIKPSLHDQIAFRWRFFVGLTLWMLYSFAHLPLNAPRFLRFFMNSIR
jgi:hypothetical protein